MHRSRRRRARNRIAFAVLFGITLFTTGMGIRIYRASQQPDQREIQIALLLARPRPNLTYWSSEFVRATFSISSHYTPDGDIVYDDFSDQWFTVKDGERLVVDNPRQPTRTVWLFGNSSTFDSYTPDALTWASQLQKYLNLAGYRWRVRNLGISGALVSEQVSRLNHTHIDKGDIVIFLDGIADFVNEKGSRDIKRYWQQVALGRAYSRAYGAAFYHFVQPNIVPSLPLSSAIRIPESMYIDQFHLDSYGDAILARYVFDAITTF